MSTSSFETSTTSSSAGLCGNPMPMLADACSPGTCHAPLWVANSILSDDVVTARIVSNDLGEVFVLWRGWFNIGNPCEYFPGAVQLEKFGADGTSQWRRTWHTKVFNSSSGDDGPPLGLAATHDGGVIIAGVLESQPADFGAAPLSCTSGSVCALVMRLGPTGAAKWALGGNGMALQTEATYAAADDVAVDASDEVFIVGEASSGIDLGGNAQLPAGTTTEFAAKITPSGQASWVTAIGGGTQISADPSGNTVVSGYARDQKHAYYATLDPSGAIKASLVPSATTPSMRTDATLTPTGDVFVAWDTIGTNAPVDFGGGPLVHGLVKLGPDLKLVWQGPSGANLVVNPRPFALPRRPFVDDAGNATLVLNGSVGFPSGAMVMSLDPSGTPRFVERVADESLDDVVVTPTGDWIVAGGARPTVDLGTGPLGIPPGQGFVARIPPP